MKRISAAVAAALLVVLAACSSPTATPGASPGTGDTPAAAEVDLKLGDTSLGQIIVDGDGMTAYIFTKDTADSGESACTGECLQAWPPILSASETPSVAGITGKVGTIPTPDGKFQVTVNGLPLYYFAQDAAVGDVKGEGVNEVWYVVGADGKQLADSSGY